MGPDRAGGLPLVRDRGVEVLPDHDTGHIGNTLVPAVPGKGIVDAMVLATDDTDTTGTAELLAATGWDHARGSTPWCPFLLAGVEHDGNRTQARVHVVGAGSDEATAQRGLAAALREDPDLRQEYGSPKGEVVAEGTTNPARYSMKKTGRVLATRTGWGYRPCPTRASRDHRVDRRRSGIPAAVLTQV